MVGSLKRNGYQYEFWSFFKEGLRWLWYHYFKSYYRDLAISFNFYLVVLSIVIIGIIQNGVHLKILKSDDYSFQYNDVNNEYYVYTNEDEVKLNLYSIGNKQNMTVSYFNADEVISRNIFDDFFNVVLSSQNSNNYYILDYKNDSLKIYIYKMLVNM